jgi:hypothetical protein
MKLFIVKLQIQIDVLFKYAPVSYCNEKLLAVSSVCFCPKPYQADGATYISPGFAVVFTMLPR